MNLLRLILGLLKNMSGRVTNHIPTHNFSLNDFMQQEINRQNMENIMEEGRKSVTPFDMGGYLRGDGFNPSDTMAADMQREQMNQMNDMNNMNNMF